MLTISAVGAAPTNHEGRGILGGAGRVDLDDDARVVVWSRAFKVDIGRAHRPNKMI